MIRLLEYLLLCRSCRAEASSFGLRKSAVVGSSVRPDAYEPCCAMKSSFRFRSTKVLAFHSQ